MNTDEMFDAAMQLAGFRKVEGQVQLVMAQWVPGKGWLTTRRGITVCGPIAAQPTGEDAVALEAKTGYRALQHRLAKEAADEV